MPPSSHLVTDLWVELFEIVTQSGDMSLQKLIMIAIPIANKYREGKLKSTLGREWKVRETVEGERQCPLMFSVLGTYVLSLERCCSSSSWLLSVGVQLSLALVVSGNDACYNWMRFLILNCFGRRSQLRISVGIATRLETRTKECKSGASLCTQRKWSKANWKRIMPFHRFGSSCSPRCR